MKKVWLYHRESTKEAAERAKLCFEKLRKFAEKNDYEVVGQSFDHCSWRDTERRSLLVAEEAVKNREADAILVINFRVLGRDIQTILEIYQSIGRPESLLSTEGEEVSLLAIAGLFQLVDEEAEKSPES